MLKMAVHAENETLVFSLNFDQNPSLLRVPFRIKLILRMHWLGHPGLSNRTEAP